MAALDFPSSPTEGQLYPVSSPRWRYANGRWVNYVSQVVHFQLFCGDHTNPVTTGANKARMLIPVAFKAVSIRFDFTNGANGASAFVADVNLVGSGSIMTTNKLLIDANESSTTTASTLPTLTTTEFAAGDILEVDFDSGSGGIGPLLTLVGEPI